MYTVLVDSAALDYNVSLDMVSRSRSKRANSHGRSGGADASGDIIVQGLRRGTDVVDHGCFGPEITKIARHRGVWD